MSDDYERDYRDSLQVMRRSMGVNLHQKIADEVPQIKRGRVWCHKCGHTEQVDGAHCLRHGWPLHCGQTMSIDSPEERKATTSTLEWQNCDLCGATGKSPALLRSLQSRKRD